MAASWDDLRVLLEVSRAGSFLLAGQRLGLSTSTVARRVAGLEREHGPLVHRTSQGAQLESNALALVELARRFEQEVSARKRDGGVVRVSLPDGFEAYAARAAVRLRAKHPETFVEVMRENQFVDLAAREADIGVRAARSSSRVLIERVIGDVQTTLFASPAYFKTRPRRITDFSDHDFIGDGTNGPTQWLMARGATRFAFRSNSVQARMEAARGGLGLVLQRAGVTYDGLVAAEVDPPFAPLRFYLTMHKDLRKVPCVRDMAQLLMDELKA